MTDATLFDYPHSPGYKVGGTSKEAAQKVRPWASRLTRLCLSEFNRLGSAGATADEMAAIIRESRFGTRPRITELKKQNFIVASGAKRKNKESGLNANVWVITKLGRIKVAGIGG